MHLRLDGQAVYYPYSPAQLRKDNPGISFPEQIPDIRLADWGVYPVTPSNPPQINEQSQDLIELTPVKIADNWTQVWSVRDLTPEEIEQRRKASVPSVVTMRQARLALLAAGLLDDVEDALVTAPREYRIEWEYATEVQRNYGLVNLIATSLGLTEVQIDDLFIAAAQL